MEYQRKAKFVLHKLYTVFFCVAFLVLSACGSSSDNEPKPPEVDARLSSHLQQLQEDYTNYQGTEAFTSSDATLNIVDSRSVMLTITTTVQDAPQLVTQLEGLGMTHIARYKHLVSGVLPIAQLDKLESMSSIRWVSSTRALSHAGIAINEGNFAMAADRVKAQLDVDGAGISIGVMSDSYNCLGGADTDISTGDLPSDVRVVKEYSFCEFGASDEGRAMMQLIHDIAPGAKLLFHTAFESPVGFAQGIVALADAGADIIVDDVGWLTMPMFQEGPIAQAVNEVKARGVSYFSAAGNSARNSYENKFMDNQVINTRDIAHDFGLASGGESDFYQEISLSKGQFETISFQWASAAEIAGGSAGADSDLDVFVFDSRKTKIIARGTDNNIGHDPVELLGVVNTTDSDTLYLYISHRAGNMPSRLKYVFFNGTMTIEQYATHSSTIVGHPNAEGAIAVGAMSYTQTPGFNGESEIEDFSSIGGTPILFDNFGEALSGAEYRTKPEIVAVDDIDTTFFGGEDTDGSSFLNFKGTSAAAPNAAAVAALLLQKFPYLNPDQVKQVMMQGTMDLVEPPPQAEEDIELLDVIVSEVILDENDPALPIINPCRDGVQFDWATGCGLIQADLMFEAVSNISISGLGDFNNDGCVNAQDTDILVAVARSSTEVQSDYDLTGDGIITDRDFSALLALYDGECG